MLSGATSVKRKIDWLPSLVQHITETAHEPFEWGVNDCGKAAARAVEAMTGVDVMKDIGSYSDFKGAIKELKKKGYKDHVDMVVQLFEEIPISFARVGDLAVVDTEEGPAIGVVQGEYIYVTTRQGRALVPLLDAQRAFRV
jgi:hypothetical protein